MTITTIDGRDLPSHLDGDWEITLSYEEYSISTSVVAGTSERALAYAEMKLPAFRDEPLEVIARLVGVYGGMIDDDETCETCHAPIEGGNPFSRYCDTHLESVN